MRCGLHYSMILVHFLLFCPSKVFWGFKLALKILHRASASQPRSRIHLADAESISIKTPGSVRDVSDSNMVGVPPKSSILIGFSIINHPFGGTPIYGKPHMRREETHADLKSEDSSNYVGNMVYAWQGLFNGWLLQCLLKLIGPCRFRLRSLWFLWRQMDWDLELVPRTWLNTWAMLCGTLRALCCTWFCKHAHDILEGLMLQLDPRCDCIVCDWNIF